MPDRDTRAGLFPALLKHWRGQRGLSQLDLALAADVSARHVSFLETGRSSPSESMVLRLGSTLGVPLRHINAMLEAAGHEAVYEDSGDELPPSVAHALARLKQHQEPWPLIIVDRTYAVRDLNRGALRLLSAVLGLPLPAEVPPPEVLRSMGMNLAKLSFDPAGAHPAIVNFDDLGRELLWRIQREVLADPDDQALRALLDDLLAMPTVDPDWRTVDLSVTSDPALAVVLRSGDVVLRFLTMVTAFQAPQNVSVEDLRVEQWFPSDEATAEACRSLVEG
ncbi:MAG: helix-turn-helix domain-containing protein [Myxococcota bacterium]